MESDFKNGIMKVWRKCESRHNFTKDLLKYLDFQFPDVKLVIYSLQNCVLITECVSHSWQQLDPTADKYMVWIIIHYMGTEFF